MIEEFKSISEINTNLVEGKLLMMAMAILTSIDHEDIKNHEYGGMSHPDNVIAKIVELTSLLWKWVEIWRNKKE